MLNTILRRAARSLVLVPLLVACGRSAQVSSPAGGPPAPASQSISINDGESLIRAMHARYDGRWYRTITFIQRTTLYTSSGSPTEQAWYEALSLPGRLRIDYINPDLGNGALFRADSNYQISGGRVVRSGTGWNELLVLGFDVYNQPPAVTISILRSLGYQLSRIRSASFDGRSVYVIGSSGVSDSTSKQFWVERDRLVFSRAMEKRPDGRQSDIRFGDWTPAGNGWIARQVFHLLDGRTRLHEKLSNIKPDAPLDPAIFDPRQWATAKHWSKP